MSFIAYVVSGTIFMIGYYIKQYFSSAVLGSVVQYFGGPTAFYATQYVESIIKNYRFDKISQQILIKYLEDIDMSIKENVLDIEASKKYLCK